MPSATSYSPRSFVWVNSRPLLNIRPSIVFGRAVNSAGSMVKRVSSTNNVIRFSFGPNGAVVCCINCVVRFAGTNDDEQCGLDDKIDALVLGNGDRRACCSCDFDGKLHRRTLFLWQKKKECKFFEPMPIYNHNCNKISPTKINE